MADQQKSVGIWIRVSTEDQVQGESPEHHERRARYYAESKNWNVAEVYRLEAVSGKSVMDHAETKRMLADIRAQRITGLIFSKLARLARNTKELLEFAEIFRTCNADLISLQESIDTSSPAGRLFYTMIAAMAQWEREEIAERVAASVPIRAKLGKPLGGAAPFGYQWLDKKLVPDPKEAPIRKLMYDLFLEHRRKKTVARLLNEAGHRTRNGSRFSDTTVGRLLLDPSAKGLRRANYTKSLGEKKHWKLKPSSEWVFTEIEPIVSEEIWETCNKLLDEQQRSNKRPTRKAIHLFTGIAFCHCGSKMYVPFNSPKYICYSCRNKIVETDLETIFHEQLKTFFFSPTEIAGYLSKADELLKEKSELLKNIVNEQKRIKDDMERLVRLHLDNELPKEGFGRHYGPLEEQLVQLEARIPELQAEIDFMQIQYMSSDQILHEARDLYGRWQSLSRDEKRKIAESITERIIIGKDDISIHLCYLPSASEMATERQHNLRVALPFCQTTLIAQKPSEKPYPKELVTIGDHIRKRRFDLNLLQKDVARLLSVDPTTITNWEKGRCKPRLYLLPRVFKFLAHSPTSVGAATTLGDKIKAYRLIKGLNRRKMASVLNIDPGSLARLERNKGTPTSGLRQKVLRFLRTLPEQI